MSAEWWEKRARLRYRQWKVAEETLARVEVALLGHADCWPDCHCVDLSADIKAALEGGTP